MAKQVAELLRSYQPDVVITYPPNGLSGHPDHIRTHDLVQAALHTLTTESATKAAEFAAAQLYYIALSRSRLTSLTGSARAALGPEVWLPPEEMAVDDAEVTIAIDITAYWDIKLAALAAHASQSDAAALLQVFTAASQHDHGPRAEEYIRAQPAAERGTHPEHNFQPLAPGPCRQHT